MDSGRRIIRPLTRLTAAFLLLCTAAASAQQQAAPDLLPPREAFRLQAAHDVPERVRLTWTIAPGYYLYRDRFRFESAGGVPLRTLAFPSGQSKEDPYFGPTEIFRDRVIIELALNAAGEGVVPVFLRVISQGCADIGVCFPPQTVRLTLTTGENVSVRVSEVTALTSEASR